MMIRIMNMRSRNKNIINMHMIEMIKLVVMNNQIIKWKNQINRNRLRKD